MCNIFNSWKCNQTVKMSAELHKIHYNRLAWNTNVQWKLLQLMEIPGNKNGLHVLNSSL